MSSGEIPERLRRSSNSLFEMMSRAVGHEVDATFSNLDFRTDPGGGEPDRITGKGEAASFGMDASHRGGDPGFVRLIFQFETNAQFQETLFTTLTGKCNEHFVEIESARSYPVRGMSSSGVLREHGEPQERTGPVGNPPISSWTYDEFTVYFESDLVITTVAGEDRLPTELVEAQ